MTTPPGRSDAELATAASAGDRAAFAEIYDRYADHIFDLCASVLRDRTDAADAAQETFLIAAQRLGQLREPAKLRAWLFAIARHEALRLTRGRNRVRPTEEVDVLPEPAGDPSRPAENAELRRLVQEAAAGLDARDRTVLELHLRRGLEGQELADALGVSENHAGVIMHRVRARFERALGAWLVARQGSRDCPQLQELLADWDGRFSPLVRKRVARHVDRCETCAETKARIASPAALLARVPLVPAPLVLREQVLGRVELTSGASPLPRGWRDGFPPPLYPPRWAPRRRGQRVGAAAAAALLVLGGLGWSGGQWYDGDGFGGGWGPAAAETGTPSPTAAPRPDPPDRPTRPARTSPPAASTGPSPTATATATPGPTPGQTASPTPAPTTPFPPASLGQVSADPADIQQEGSICGDPEPEIATILVEVVEHNVLSFVYLHWSVADEEGVTGSMARVGDSDVRQAQIGPFPEDTLPVNENAEVPVELWVEVIDTYGQQMLLDLPEETLTLHHCTLI